MNENIFDNFLGLLEITKPNEQENTELDAEDRIFYYTVASIYKTHLFWNVSSFLKS